MFMHIIMIGIILLSSSSIFSMNTMQFDRERKYALEKIDILIENPEKNGEKIRRILKELIDYIPTVKGVSAAWQEEQKKFVADQQKRLTNQLLKEEEQQLFVTQFATLRDSIKTAVTIDELNEYYKTAKEIMSSAPVTEKEKKDTLNFIKERIDEKIRDLHESAHAQPKHKRKHSGEAEHKEQRSSRSAHSVSAIRKEFEEADKQGDSAGVLAAIQKMDTASDRNNFSQKEINDLTKKMWDAERRIRGFESLFEEFTEEFNKFKDTKNIDGMEQMRSNLSNYSNLEPMLKAKQKSLLQSMDREIALLKGIPERETKGEEEIKATQEETKQTRSKRDYR